jgi:hypothetical protein
VIAAVSSITVCVVSSLLFFVIGYACGHKRRGDQEATRALTDMTRTQISQPNPMVLYEEILPEIESKPNIMITNQFKFEDNVAYNPLK